MLKNKNVNVSKTVQMSLPNSATVSTVRLDAGIAKNNFFNSNRVLSPNFQLRSYRQFRMRVYSFLERPTNKLGILYHVGMYNFL